MSRNDRQDLYQLSENTENGIRNHVVSTDSRENEKNTLREEATKVDSNNTLRGLTSQQQDKNDLQRESTRNQQFDPEYEPFRDNHALQVKDEEIDGAIWFMGPTRAIFTYLGTAEWVRDAQGSEQFISQEGQEYADSRTSDIEYKWTSRNNRKGRHALIVHQSEEHYDTPPSTTGMHSILRGLWRMGTVFSFSDITYLTAVSFTLAVTVLLVNAVLALMPYSDTTWRKPPGIYIAEGVLTVVGCCLFLISSFLSFLEAANSNRRGCFGWKRQHISYHDATDSDIEHGGSTRMVPDRRCAHRTNNFGNLFRKSDNSSKKLSGSKTNDSSVDQDQWRWFPTNYELWKHFIFDLGFVTCVILLLSSAVYCSAAVAALVSIVLSGGNVSRWIRIPQLVAGIGFTTCSLLFMVETQTRWLKPELRVIGWHISFWNLLGSVGFTLCAAFALAGAEAKRGEWAEYQFVSSYVSKSERRTPLACRIHWLTVFPCFQMWGEFNY